MKYLLLLIATLIVGTSCIAKVQNYSTDDETTTKELILDEFTGLVIENTVDVFVSLGDKQSVKVIASDSDMKRLDISSENQVCTISDVKHSRGNVSAQVYITVKKIQAINVSGSGNVVANNINADKLTLLVTGSGDISLKGITGVRSSIGLNVIGSGDICVFDLYTPVATAKVKGSGDIEIKGSSNTLNAHVTGSGDIDASKFESLECDVSVTGSGDCLVWAANKLDVSIVGSGDVGYKGQPQIKSDITGTGDLYRN